MSVEYNCFKFICTVLVVVGHVCSMYISYGTVVLDESPSISFLRSYIYDCVGHMPCFFAISGAIYSINLSHNKYLDFIAFLKKKSYRLLVPYILIAVFFLFPTMLIVSEISSPIAYFVNSYLLLQDNKHLWFLITLFCVFICMHFIKPMLLKCSSAHALLLLVLFMILLVTFDNKYTLLPTFITYLFWFNVGFCIQRYLSFNKIGNMYFFTLPIISTLLWIYFPHVKFFSILSNVLFYVVGLKLSTILIRVPSVSRLSHSVSSYAMGIYLFHPIFIYVIAYILKPFSLPNSISFILLFLFSFSLSVIIVRIIKRVNLKFILGE